MKPTVTISTLTVERDQRKSRADVLAVEESMEIRVGNSSIAVTMRTPGHDFELAAGFLFTEGVVAQRGDIREIRYHDNSNPNVIVVELNSSAKFEPGKLTRHVFTSSSCGVCSKATLEQVRAVLPQGIRSKMPLPSSEIFCALPKKLRAAQEVFASTGGLHATALFDANGKLLLLREDVGRHNAMDKVIGAWLMEGKLPAANTIALVSGRASFELIQKAAMAGIPVLAAVGAPSSLAVETARDMGMTLVGFLREGRFNVYCGSDLE